MPRTPALKPREVVRRFKKLGFVEHHQVGSHLTLKHPKTGKRAVIPMHLKDMRKGTLLAVLRESGIDKDAFLSA